MVNISIVLRGIETLLLAAFLASCAAPTPAPYYPLPTQTEDEPWKETEEKVKYMPLQAQEGDLAIYLQRHAIEVQYEGEKYVILPQAAILMLERFEDL